MNKFLKIFIWVLICITIVFMIISFIWVNFAPSNKVPTVDKIKLYLDNTKYIKIKRETSFDCESEFEITIKDEETLKYIKDYIEGGLENFSEDVAVAAVKSGYYYILSFYDNEDYLLFKVSSGIIYINNREHGMINNNEGYQTLKENILNKKDSCLSIYMEYVDTH